MLDIARPDSFYRQTNDILEAYYKQGATYLSKMTGKPLSECEQFVRSRPIKDPKVVFNVRDPRTLDRHEEETTLRQYLKMCKEENLILAPTLTAYLPPSEKRSFLGRFIIKKMKERGVFKKRMFECKMAKDDLGQQTNKSLQSVAKELNNSASGAQSIPSNAIFNKSAHPTLTSGCRSSTSYANMHNEMFLGGNRPYFTYHDVINHTLATCTQIDRNEVQLAINAFNLYVPTPEDCWAVTSYSLNKYSSLVRAKPILMKLFESLDDIERTALCYVNDLKALAMFNETLVKEILYALSTHNEPIETENLTDKYKNLPGDVKTMVLFQNGFLFKGKPTDEILKDDPSVDLLNKNAASVEKTLTRYEPIINAFWLADILPPNHAYMDYVRREIVPVSDTDSTVFTNQDWTKFVTGSYNFEELSFRVGNTTTYITAKIVSHHLKKMSTNFNISREEITRIRMKNEFYFTVLALTDVAKHYACLIWGQEGNVLPHLEPEIKGVNLRNSAWPEDIKEKFTNYIVDLLTKISEGKTLTRKEVLGPPLDVERDLIKTMTSGTYSLYNRTPVNNAEAYKKPESSPYQTFVLWNDVFAPKYGEAPQPPYQGIRVPVNLSSPSEIKSFVNSLDDKALSARLENYVRQKNRKDIKQFTLPEPILAEKGVPKEIIEILNKDKLLSNVTGGFYLSLGAFGIFPRDKNYTVSLVDVFDNDALLTL